MTNERVCFSGAAVAVNSVLRAIQVVGDGNEILGGVDVVVRSQRGRHIEGRIRASKSARASGRAPFAEGHARCAELIIGAARAGTLTLAGIGAGASFVRCWTAELDPSTGWLIVRTDDQPFAATEVVRGSLEAHGTRYQFVAAVMRQSPLAICVPERLDEVPCESPPEWLTSGDGDGDWTAAIESPFGSSRDPRRVVDLSLVGLSFDFDATRELFPAGLRLPDIALEVEGRVLHVRGDVKYLRGVSPTIMRCGVSIAAPAPELAALRALLAARDARRPAPGPSEYPSVERIDDAVRIRELLDALLRFPAAQVTLGIADSEPVVVPPPAIDDDGIRWAVRLQPPVTARIVVYTSVYCFQIESSECLDAWRSTLPVSLLRIRQRWFRRAAPTQEESIWFGGRALDDVSYGGLSFIDGRPRGGLGRGDKLRDTCVDSRGVSAQLEAEVRSVDPVSGGSRYGLEAVPCTAEDRASFHDIVHRILHPTTRTGSEWTESLWSLYERSGYFELSGKSPSHFASLEHAFASVARKLDRAAHLGCHVVFPSQAVGAAAAVSVLKVYSRSWLGFQMAKVKGDTREGVAGRAVLRDIHVHAYEHVQRDPELGWVIGYLQVKPVWSRLVHYDLPRKYVERGDACVIRFQAIEIVARHGPEDPDVARADTDETALVLAVLARTRPTAYIEALDLTPARYDLRSNEEAWRAAGLARERTTLVLRRGGVPVAAAILEVGEDGAHLFRLLDLVRLVPLSRGAHVHYPRLLREAGRWFAAHGKQAFVLFREEGTRLDLEQVDVAQDMGLADMSILSGALVPELLERVHELTAPSALATSPGLRGGSLRLVEAVRTERKG
jgi:hypothetical protein